MTTEDIMRGEPGGLANVLGFTRTKVTEIPRPVQGPSQPTEPSIAMLMATIEEMDRGIKMMIAVIAEQDKRIRYLELASATWNCRTARRNARICR